MPIKRSKALQPLSRQHHNGLLFCLLLKKGVRKNALPEAMAGFISHFWQADLQAHFEAEESTLLPLTGTYPLLGVGLKRMMKEHVSLETLIGSIANDPATASIEELGLELEKHIRFEEQVLFPLVENSLPFELLSALGEQLKESDEKDNCMNYANRFWE